MNCQQVQERLGQPLSDEEMARCEEHLEGCPACQTAMETGLPPLPGEWRDEAPAPDLVERTMARLAAEDRPLPWWHRLYVAGSQALRTFALHQPRPLTTMATLMVAMVLLVPVLSPNFHRGRSSGAVVGCRANLRLLGKALDRYAASHEGRYPASLAELQPDYAHRLPACPSAGQDSYSAGYQIAPDRLHYTLRCHGENHREDGLGPDQPDLVR